VFRSDRILALDVGASKIVLAEFATSKNGVPQLLDYAVGSLGAEPDSELDVSAYIVSAIRELLREHAMRAAPLLITMSGQAVFPRYVKLPPVTRDKVLQIIQYEAEQNVPFPIDEVVWDYQLISGSATGEQSVMLVAVKTENVVKLTDCVQAAGLEPEVVDVAPMALYNTVRYNYPGLEGCTMVLDIGARSSSLIFIEESKIFSRSIPVAGNGITQEIQKEFEISFAEAEAIKIEHAFVGFGGVYAGAENETADRVSKIVRNVVTRLHAEVNRSINFYRSQQGGSPPSLVLLTGGSSVIPHMDTFFREKLSVEVEALNPFINVPVGEKLNADRVSEDLHMLGEVVGLALRRSLTCPVEINLMPPNLVAKKIFRKRVPFFALSAASLALTMLCWWGYFHRTQTMLDEQVQQVEAKSGHLELVDRQLKEQTLVRRRAKTRADELLAVVGLRTRWLGMIEAVHGVMLDGMWLTAVHPVVEKGAVTHVEISGRGFVDKLKDKEGMSAIEQLCELLAQAEFFTDETKIVKLAVISAEDYAREFTISAALRDPIKVGQP